MKASIRPLFCLPLIAAALTVLTPPHAQKWPNKPVRLVASFPPGTPGDVIARLIQP